MGSHDVKFLILPNKREQTDNTKQTQTRTPVFETLCPWFCCTSTGVSIMQVSLHQIFSTMLLASLLLTCTQRGEWTALSVSHYGNDVVLTTVEKKKKKTWRPVLFWWLCYFAVWSYDPKPETCCKGVSRRPIPRDVTNCVVTEASNGCVAAVM